MARSTRERSNEKDAAEVNETEAHLNRARYGRGINSFAVSCVLINLFVLLIRPQNDIPPLATIQLPFILSLLSFFAWLPKAPRGWSKQMRLMMAIVIMGALWVPFALNNRYAFEGFRTLAQLFLMILFPAAIFFQGGKWLEKLFRLFCFTGFYLAIYGATHGGRGPGDYLGDENDLCLALVFHLALLLGLLGVPTSPIRRTTILAICGALIATIVITSSRGGFLGMAVVVVFHILYARRRAGFFILAAVLALFTMALAPAKYWERIRTIADTDTGSAKERRETWAFAWDLFTRPQVMFIGVGMKNTPVYLGDYKTSESRNLWGRQTHSLYLELLPDLGLVGGGMVLTIFWASFFGNRRLLKGTIQFLAKLKRLQDDERRERQAVMKELITLRAILLSINAAWLGVAVCGAFISILYYPPIWLLAVLSTAVQAYAVHVHRAAESLIPERESNRARLAHHPFADV